MQFVHLPSTLIFFGLQLGAVYDITYYESFIVIACEDHSPFVFDFQKPGKEVIFVLLRTFYRVEQIFALSILCFIALVGSIDEYVVYIGSRFNDQHIIPPLISSEFVPFRAFFMLFLAKKLIIIIH